MKGKLTLNVHGLLDIGKKNLLDAIIKSNVILYEWASSYAMIEFDSLEDLIYFLSLLDIKKL